MARCALRKRTITAAMIAAFTAILFLAAAPATLSQDGSWSMLPLDAAAQLRDGLNPKVTLDTGGARNGRFRIMDNCWWMFFLHLRPLEGAEPLNPATVRDLVLTFWSGDGSPVGTLTGREGILDLPYRTVYWAEMRYTHGGGKARFYVWDEPGNNRRLIADCNINVERETPDSLLTVVQEQMALSVDIPDTLADLKTAWPVTVASFPELKLKLDHPSDSRAAIYPGFDAKRGNRPPPEWASIWVMPVGIEWRFDLTWGPLEDAEPEKWIAGLLPDSLADEVEIRTDSLALNPVYENQWTGLATVSTVSADRRSRTFWCLAAMSWEHRGLTFRSLAATQVYRDWWGIPFDGSVPDDTLNARAARWFLRINSAPVWMGGAKR